MELSPEYVALTHARALLTLDLAERRWSARRSDEDNTLLWLRAARAAWAAGDGSEAAAWYRRSADGLLAIAQRFGLGTGTYAYYAEVALGAAALASGPPIIDRVSGDVRIHAPGAPRPSRMGTGRRRGGLNAAGRAVVCAWAAWLGGAEQEAVDLLKVAEWETGRLPSAARHWWRISRWPPLRDAVSALLQSEPPALRAAIVALDRRATAGFHTTHPAGELVDETVIVLAREWRIRHADTYDPRGLHVLVEPGAVASAGGGDLRARAGGERA